jgi:hypothetical protein
MKTYTLAMRRELLKEFMTCLTDSGVGSIERGGWCRERGMVLAVPKEGNVHIRARTAQISKEERQSIIN